MTAQHKLDNLDLLDHDKFWSPGAGAELEPVFDPIIIVPVNGENHSRRTRPGRIHVINASLHIICMGINYNAARGNAIDLLNLIIAINTDDVGEHTYTEQFSDEASPRVYTPLSATYKEVDRDLAGVSLIVVECQMKLDGTWS